MGLLNAFLMQQITHWRKTGVDGHNQPTFATPATLNARWEERSQYFVDADGIRLPSRSTIFLENDVTVGDYLYNGISVATDPRTVIGAFRILDFRKIPDLTATEFERRALL